MQVVAARKFQDATNIFEIFVAVYL